MLVRAYNKTYYTVLRKRSGSREISITLELLWHKVTAVIKYPRTPAINPLNGTVSGHVKDRGERYGWITHLRENRCRLRAC